MMNSLKRVDHAALRTNQAGIIVLLLLAYVLNSPLLVALVMVLMLGGTLLGKPGFLWFYRLVLQPLNLIRSDILLDNPEPHRFAQGFGGTVLLAGFAALQAGLPGLGWALVWLVIALAALNLFVGFCAGCAVYYWLNRMHVPGFVKAPPENTFPGSRPRIPVTGREEEQGQ